MRASLVAVVALFCVIGLAMGQMIGYSPYAGYDPYGTQGSGNNSYLWMMMLLFFFLIFFLGNNTSSSSATVSLVNASAAGR